MQAPLIVTLSIDAAAHAHFNALRNAYFPPERLVVGAHITMFHAIPASCEARLLELTASLCAEMPPFPVAVVGIRFLGRGVAYALSAPQAGRLRAQIASPVSAELTAQDRSGWSPHITIQNKVDPSVARRTAEELRARKCPETISAIGVAIWRYQGGPWESLTSFRFKERDSEPSCAVVPSSINP